MPVYRDCRTSGSPTDRPTLLVWGPNDLALSMGVEAGHPDHEAALQRFREGCERAGKPSGLPAGDAETALRRVAEGFQFIDLTNDFRLLESAARQAIAAVS